MTTWIISVPDFDNFYAISSGTLFYFWHETLFLTIACPRCWAVERTNKTQSLYFINRQLLYQGKLIKMINIKSKPNSSLSYQRSSPSRQIGFTYRALTPLTPQSSGLAQTCRLGSNWADRVTEHRFRSKKEDTLETASTPRAPYRQSEDTLDQGRWWAKNESDTSLQYLIKRQRDKNEKLRHQIQEQRKNHSRRMQLVNSQIKNIKKQYDSYEVQIASLAAIFDRLGI